MGQNVAVTSAQYDDPGHSLERTVYFSDAVIAIALTLLALDLPVPEKGQNVTVFLGEHFGDQYLHFLISFAVIAMYWWQHHRLFQRVARLSGRLVFFNIVSLLAIVIVPFATRMLGVEGPLGPVFYASTMVLWGAAYVLMVITVQAQGLWRENTAPWVGRNMIIGTVSALGVFALSIPIAFVSANAAEYFWLVIPVTARLGRLLNRTPAPEA